MVPTVTVSLITIIILTATIVTIAFYYYCVDPALKYNSCTISISYIAALYYSNMWILWTCILMKKQLFFYEQATM